MVRRLQYLWNLSAAVLVAGMVIFAQPAAAATVGQAVATLGADPAGGTVGSTEIRAALGGEAIKYFIPLIAGSGTYGVTNGGTFGTVEDSGIGGGILTMFLSFSGVSTTQSSILNIVFEDLDLDPVNTPTNFFETVEMFISGGSVTGKIVDLTNAFVTANGQIVTLSFDLGVLSNSLFGLQFLFDSSFLGSGTPTNTPEYLLAEISAVPLPAALPLFLAALAGLGLYRRRRQRNLQALQRA